MKVVLCGPPHSGKSCLRDGLKQAIMPLSRKGKAPYPNFITACPDGEGAWFAETARRDLNEAMRYKANYKSDFSREFAEVRAQWVRDSKEPLTFVDVGGKIDHKNRLIMQYATHAVIISKDLNLVADWLDFCGELNLKVIAILESDLHGTEDKLESEFPILRGSIHGLKRGEDVSNRLMVNKLAEVLLRLIE